MGIIHVNNSPADKISILTLFQTGINHLAAAT